MSTIEKVKQLSDNEIISVYQGFSGFLMNRLNVNPVDIIKNLPKDLTVENDLNSLSKVKIDKLETILKPDEVIPVVKIQMYYWAENSEMAPLLDDYLESNKIETMAAGTILAIGTVLVMTIVSTSLKIEIEDGKFRLSYGSHNINNNAVELVKAVMAKIPDSIQNILS